MIKHFGWENYRYHVPPLEIEEQIQVWLADVAGQVHKENKYVESLGSK